MTTWLDLQDDYNELIRKLRERGYSVNGKGQSEDSDQDSTPTPAETTAEPKTTPDGIPVGVMFLPGRENKKK